MALTRGRKAVLLGSLVLLFVMTSALAYTQISLDRLISYRAKRQTLEQHLVQLEDALDLSFTYSPDLKNFNNRHTFWVKNKPLRKLLDQLGRKYRFSYKLIGNQIVLKENQKKITPPLIGISPQTVLKNEEKKWVQTIRGKIVDAQSKAPLIGANIFLLAGEGFKGTATDEKGEFVLENIPVGRQSFEATYIGYDSYQVTGLKVISGKENHLLIELTESANVLSEIVVKAKVDKMSPINEMASISARTFSVEETSRYAASFSDPARMAKSFPGVSFINDLENEIIVRGNPPVSLLWRLEGVPIPNPNHFGSIGSSSGAISMLSSNTLSNSDFLTGAFPSEYGNSLSGVFDLKMRIGNPVKRESTFMFGSLGIDFSTEGPFNKKKPGSYLVNYRYSSLAVLDQIGLNPTETKSVPDYQDISFKLHFPTSKNGIFDVFGLGGFNRDRNIQDFRPTNDPDDYFEELDRNTLALLGVSHLYPLSSNDYFKTTFAFSFYNIYYEFNRIEQSPDLPFVNLEFEDYEYLQTTLNFSYTRKFNTQHHLRLGFTQNANWYEVDYDLYNLNRTDSTYSLLDERGLEQLFQSYLQWQYRPSDKWTLNFGFHQMYYTLNKALPVEPRLSGEWRFADRQTLSFGIGKHSHVGDITTYLARRFDPISSGLQPFKELDIPKAWHFILGHQVRWANNWHAKTELYYQYLFDVPVSTSPDYPLQTTFNISNNYDVLNVVEVDFSNAGTGRNIGLELTIEKFFSNQYYVLFTGSLYDARYKTFDDKLFSTRFNGNYILNLVSGREWLIKQKNLFSFNTRLVYADGNRYTPIDEEASREENRQILRGDLIYAEKTDNYFRLDLGLTYTINKKSVSHAFQLDIQNIFHIRNLSGFYYDRGSEQVRPIYQTGIIPILFYKFSF